MNDHSACYARTVNVLAERWPATGTIPRIALTSLPTPLHALPRVSERLDTQVWIKRDDLTASEYGGNKVRKLEYVLARAEERRADTLVTTGSAGSHHVFATALYGRSHGFTTHAVVTPHPRTQHAEDQLRADLYVGARLHPAQGYPSVAKAVAELVVKLRLSGQRPFVVPAGGSSVYGALGYVNAGLELARQIDAGECADPASVYVACGSCATAAGLALGLAAAGVKTRVVAVRVTDAFMANRVRLSVLVQKATALLRELDARFPDVADRAIDSIHLDDVELGRGAGQATPSAQAAARLAAEEGLTLDSAYTGKAFACLLREAEANMRGKKLVYVHTLSSASLEPYLSDAPVIPPELDALLG